MVGGPLAGRVQHVAQIYSICYLPFILLMIKQGIQTGKLSYFIPGGAFLGFALVTGYHLGLLISICSIFFFLIYFPKSTNKKQFLRNAFIFYIMAVGISAIQVIPSLEFTRWSFRTKYDFAAATSGSMNPQIIFTIVFSNFFNVLNGKLWAPGDVTEIYLYVGAVPFLLAAVTLSGWKKLGYETRFFVLLCVLSLLYALGKYTPLYSIFFYLIPGISLFKRPSESLFIFHLGLAMMSGVGFDLCLHMLIQKGFKWIFLAASTVLLIILWEGVRISASKTTFDPSTFVSIALGWSVLLGGVILMRTKWAKLAWIASLFVFTYVGVDLITHNSDVWFNSARIPTNVISKTNMLGNTEIVSFLNSHVMVNEFNAYRIEPIQAGSLWANAPAIFEIPSSVGYSPLFSKRYGEFASPDSPWVGRSFKGLIHSYNSRLFDLLNVKYVITSTDLKTLDPNVNADKFTAVYDKYGIRIYENNQVLPRFFFLSKAKVIKDAGVLETELLSPQFDPTSVLLLEAAPQELVDKVKQDTIEYELPRETSINLTNDAVNSITLQTASDEDAFLFASEVFYPGWTVWIDGSKKEILNADLAFRAVFVPEGRHTVRFLFQPVSFYIGAVLTALTIFFGLLMIAWQYFIVQSARLAKHPGLF